MTKPTDFPAKTLTRRTGGFSFFVPLPEAADIQLRSRIPEKVAARVAGLFSGTGVMTQRRTRDMPLKGCRAGLSYTWIG
jgi:hypothetical protein